MTPEQLKKGEEIAKKISSAGGQFETLGRIDRPIIMICEKNNPSFKAVLKLTEEQVATLIEIAESFARKNLAKLEDEFSRI